MFGVADDYLLHFGLFYALSREWFCAEVGVQIFQSRDKIYGRYLLIALHALAIERVCTLTGEAVLDVNYTPLDGCPLLHRSLGGVVVHIPLHRYALDV